MPVVKETARRREATKAPPVDVDTPEKRDARFNEVRGRFRNAVAGANVLAQPAWPACLARMTLEKKDGGGELACESPRNHPDGVHNATFTREDGKSFIVRWPTVHGVEFEPVEEAGNVASPATADDERVVSDVVGAELATAVEVPTKPASFKRMSIDVAETATPLDMLLSLAKHLGIDLPTAGIMMTPIGDIPTDGESRQAARALAYRDQASRNMVAAAAASRKLTECLRVVVESLVDGVKAATRISEAHGEKSLAGDAALVVFETIARKLRPMLIDAGTIAHPEIFVARTIANAPVSPAVKHPPPVAERTPPKRKKIAKKR